MSGFWKPDMSMDIRNLKIFKIGLHRPYLFGDFSVIIDRRGECTLKGRKRW
jgi:hypothetical protein